MIARRSWSPGEIFENVKWAPDALIVPICIIKLKIVPDSFRFGKKHVWKLLRVCENISEKALFKSNSMPNLTCPLTLKWISVARHWRWYPTLHSDRPKSFVIVAEYDMPLSRSQNLLMTWLGIIPTGSLSVNNFTPFLELQSRSSRARIRLHLVTSSPTKF